MLKLFKFITDNWKYFGALFVAISSVFVFGRTFERIATYRSARDIRLDSALIHFPSVENRIRSIENSIIDIHVQLQVYDENQKAIQASYVEYIMHDRNLIKEDFYRLTRDLDFKKDISADTARPRIKTIIQRIHE